MFFGKLLLFIDMGRKSHNLTEKQKCERRRKWRMKSYWRHVKSERLSALRRYYITRRILLQNKNIT